MAYSDDELLTIVRSERARSIGFDLDPELTEAREKALDYAKGHMPDVKSLPNRSKAVSTDVADAIETVLPDLMEIFVGGDDPVSFDPRNQADEAQAQQETDYLRFVIFEQDGGFLALYSMLKDALLTKTGIVKWWWEKAPTIEPETFSGQNAVQVMLASQDGEVTDLRPHRPSAEDAAGGAPGVQPEGGEGEGAPEQPIAPDAPPASTGEPLFDFELAKEGPDGKACLRALAPEDFTVARDTVLLAETTYCAHRSRPRAQDLIADGHDKDIIEQLPGYGIARDEQVQLARDTAGEHLFPIGNEGSDRNLRVVEVVDHYVRLLGDDDQLELWRIFTGGDESVLIKAEKVDRLPFAAVTPYLVTHRFYGESLADKLLEIQRIKTTLTRMALDNGYFSLNQRYYLDMDRAGPTTLSDLLDNRPGVPIRGNGPGAVTPLMNAAAPYDYWQALEYASTMGEQRTGVVRSAQGLNPDTLHDTAKGALALMGAAQRRTRFIARIFAETGVKDMYLGVHDLLRKHASKKVVTKLRGQWIPVSPGEWDERTQMTIEVAVGSGGKDQRAAAIQAQLTIMENVAKAMGPGAQKLIQPTNLYKAVTDLGKSQGLKSVGEYWTDPATLPQEQPGQPQPNPEMAKVQADAALQQQKLQAQQQADAAQADHARQMDQARLATDVQIAREKNASDAQLAQSKAAAELHLKQQQMEAELAMKERTITLQAQLDHQAEMARIQYQPPAPMPSVELGGAPG